MSSTRERFLDLLVVLVGVSTVAMAATVITTTFFRKPTPPSFSQRQPPARVTDWESVRGRGHHMGKAGAPITMVVFSDFECPACAYFANKLVPDLRKKYPDKIEVIYRHWPLDNHRLAYPAAHAAECAAAQGGFEVFHNAVFAQQKALGLKSFSEMARDMGMKDLRGFDRCLSDSAATRLIATDIEEAKRVGGTGTPTVVVNGWVFRGGFGADLADSVVKAMLKMD